MSYTVSKAAANASAVPHANREFRPGRATHLVKPGESLEAIAGMYGTNTQSLIALNSHQLGSNGTGLAAGQRLEL